MTSPPLPSVIPPGSAMLFFGFSRIALSGFGGVMPFAYRGLVEQHKWLTAAEFTAIVSASQLLPGPTICNVALMVGARFAGLRGAIAALAGMILGPFLIIITLGLLYQRYHDLTLVRAALGGMTAVAVGLVASTALKMALPLLRRRSGRLANSAFVLLGFAGMGLLKLPMIETVAVLAPLSIGYAYWKER